MWNNALHQIQSGDRKVLARTVSLIENEAEGFHHFMQHLSTGHTPVIGITGAPGAGKSTLTDALIALYVQNNKKVAVLCVDPSSPFNEGALLGDRIRMSRWYNEPAVFIRSLATRGSLGGLHPKIIEVTDLMKAADFDYIIVETVGVGQSEIEIAGLADLTVVVLVPEGGDEIQTMKAGIMEIADIFAVNKADRPGADNFVKNLQQMLAPAFSNRLQEIEIIKTIATESFGVEALNLAIEKILNSDFQNEKRSWLLAEKAYFLIQKEKMKGIEKQDLKKKIDNEPGDLNIYGFVKNFLNK